MPAGGALFGSSATGPGSTGGNKHLVEMRAGKFTLKGRLCVPDKRKGLLFVYQSDDSLMHFCWQDRGTGTVEDDLIIFPDDCEYVKVPQCTTGRAYLLKFKSSSRKFFFWLQEPKTDKDEENCKRINELLNNPQSVQSAQSPEQDLQSLLNNMSQSQLVQLFGNGVGQIGGLQSLLGTIRAPGSGSARTSTTPALTHRSTAPATPGTTTTGSTTQNQNTATPQNASIPATVPEAPRAPRVAPPAEASEEATPVPRIRLSDLQNFLQHISPVGTNGTTTQQQSVDLSTALTSEALTGVINNPEALEQLQSHLPQVDGTTTQESLRTTLASPQFQSAVSQFSNALESGQLGPIVSQLAVNQEAVAAAQQGNMQEFVKALEKTSSEQKPEGEKKEDDKDKDKNDEEEKMQLD